MFNGEYNAEAVYTRIINKSRIKLSTYECEHEMDTLESDGKSSDRIDYVVYLPDETEYSTGMIHPINLVL